MSTSKYADSGSNREREVSLAKVGLPIWVSPRSQPALNVDLPPKGPALSEQSAQQGTLRQCFLTMASRHAPD